MRKTQENVRHVLLQTLQGIEEVQLKLAKLEGLRSNDVGSIAESLGILKNIWEVCNAAERSIPIIVPTRQQE